MSIALRPRYRRNQYAIPRPASARPLLLAVSETETRAVDRIINALFVEGTRPTIPSILRRIRKAPWQSLTVEKVRAALLVLHHQGVLELDADWYDLYVRWDRHWDDFGDAEPWDGDTGEDLEGEAVIVLCYPPFSGNNMGISVTGLTKHYWAPGALYAFALPFAVAYEAPVIVSTRCPGCHTAITLDIEISRPPSATACDFRELPVAHFLFPCGRGWPSPSGVTGSACSARRSALMPGARASDSEGEGSWTSTHCGTSPRAGVPRTNEMRRWNDSSC